MSRWLALIVALALARSARADDATPVKTPFDRGRFGFGLGGGTLTSFGTQYFWVDASAGYFVLDGLELGVLALHAFGSGPSISEVSPSLRYVARPLVGKWPVVPYVGTFYSHWFIGMPNADLNTIGARAGLVFVSRASERGWLVLGLGAAYEHVLGACTVDCDSVYPDVTVGFVF